MKKVIASAMGLAFVVGVVGGVATSYANKTCVGQCGNVKVGPKTCPPGTECDLNCTTNPPTMGCWNPNPPPPIV